MLSDLIEEYPVDACRQEQFEWLVSRVLEHGGWCYVFPRPLGGLFENDIRRCLNSPRRKQPYYLLEISRRHSVRIPAHLRMACRMLAALDQDGRRQDVPHEEVCLAQERVYASVRSEVWWRDVDEVIP